MFPLRRLVGELVPARTVVGWWLLCIMEIATTWLSGPSLPLCQRLEASWAAMFLCLFAALATLPLEVSLGRPRWRWVGAGVLSGVLLLLNLRAFQRGFPLVPLAFIGAVGVATAGSCLRHRTCVLALRLSAPCVALALAHAGRVYYPDRYLHQHLSLSLVGFWVLALWYGSICEVLVGNGRRVVAGLAAGAFLLAGVTFPFLGRGRMSLDAAVLVARELPTPRATVVLLGPLADGDGDGYSSLLVGADCDDTDPRVNPVGPGGAGQRPQRQLHRR